MKTVYRWNGERWAPAASPAGVMWTPVSPRPTDTGAERWLDTMFGVRPDMLGVSQASRMGVDAAQSNADDWAAGVAVLVAEAQAAVRRDLLAGTWRPWTGSIGHPAIRVVDTETSSDEDWARAVHAMIVEAQQRRHAGG